MLYGTTTRASRHEIADGGLALLVRGGTIGQHRRRPPDPARPRPLRRAPREPQGAVHLLTQGLAALIVLGVAGLIGFFILAGERRAEDRRTGVPPEASDVLGSRAADPEPLSLTEVFPEPAELRPPGAARPYRIGMTHIDTQCRIATTGTLGPLLEQHGCSQVVRAEMTAPYGGYEVTAGLFNLADADGAGTVDDRVRTLVETGDGSFAAMAAGEPGADPSAPPASQVGWHARGHYLLYCVITRPGGGVVTGDDQYARRITAELVDAYLAGSVLEHRASHGRGSSA